MMNRDTVAQEANNLAMARGDLPRMRGLLFEAIQLRDVALMEYGGALGASDEIGQFCDDLSNAIGRLQKAIERIESE
jgi:hypothetical protein